MSSFNIQEFDTNWKQLPKQVKTVLWSWAIYPTTSNSNYCTGYLAALDDFKLTPYLVKVYFVVVVNASENKELQRHIIDCYKNEFGSRTGSDLFPSAG